LTVEGTLLPPENSRLPAEGIPNAKLVIFEDSGHGLIVQRPEDIANIAIGSPKNDP